MSSRAPKLDERAKELFAAVLEQPEDARAAFLARACAGNAELHRQVETLLRSLEAAERRFEEPPSVPGEQPGDRIGHYKLLQRIGEGGFGVVWMAEQEEPVRRQVALKVLKPGMDTAQVIGRFESERQALALMDHPNIAKVFDGGATPAGRPYFVMELVRGMPITNYCDGVGLGLRERLELFVQVCQAVQHAHHKGVIHRDLKPSNVLVTLCDATPVPKVIDFGIAKAARGVLTQRTVFTEFRQMLGTPEYMAPEQADISALDVDTRADVYSLGVLLYELLTGTRPFELRTLLAAGYAEMLRTIREVDPPRPSARVSTLGERIGTIARQRHLPARALGSLLRGDLDWIVMKALEKERSRRYETASALAEDVLRHLHSEPVRASPPSRVYRLRKYAHRHRLGVAAGAAIVLALAAGGATALSGYVDAREQARVARRAEARAKEESAAARASADEARRQRDAALAAERVAQSERDRAERALAGACFEARKSDCLMALVVSVFASGDPHETRERDYPVRRVLDDFERSMGDPLLGPPHPAEVEAVLRRMLGIAYDGLGLLEQAETNLARATELQRQLKGNRHGLVALSLIDQASLRHSQERYPEALALLEEAERALPPALEGGVDTDKTVRVGELPPGEERKLRIRLRKDQCHNLRHLGDLTGAEAAGWAAFEEARSLLGERSDFATVSSFELAAVLMDLERPQEAEPLLRAVLERAREGLPFARTNEAAVRNNLGACLMQLKRFDEAEQLLREARQALTLLRKRAPEDDPMIESACEALRAWLLELGHWEEALALQEERVQRLANLLGAQHPSLALQQQRLAFCLIAVGREAEAEELARQALLALEAQVPLDVASVCTARRTLAWALLEHERLEEAAQLLTPRLEECPDAVRSGMLADLAEVLLRQGRSLEAEPLARASVELRSSATPRQWVYFSSLGLVGEALRQQGRLEEADPLLGEAVMGLRAAPAARRRALPRTLESLALLHESLGRAEEAQTTRSELQALGAR